MEATLGYHPSESEAGTWHLEVLLFKEPSTSPNLASERLPSQSRSDLGDVASPGPTGNLGIECTLGSSPLKAAWFQFVLR